MHSLLEHLLNKEPTVWQMAAKIEKNIKKVRNNIINSYCYSVTQSLALSHSPSTGQYEHECARPPGATAWMQPKQSLLWLLQSKALAKAMERMARKHRMKFMLTGAGKK